MSIIHISHWDFDATFLPKDRSINSTISYTNWSVGGFYIWGEYLKVEGKIVTNQTPFCIVQKDHKDKCWPDIEEV
jgi:hypothetical protein